MRLFAIAACLAAVACSLSFAEGGGQTNELLTGQAAFGDWRSSAPGVRRLITPRDLPAPFATKSARNAPGLIRRPDRAKPTVPAGFSVDLLADDLVGPRTIRVAPNGDVFVAESGANRVRILRLAEGSGEVREKRVFAEGFDYPYGMAFYPPGPDPRYVYVAETGKVVRFPYRSGDLEMAGPAEPVIDNLPTSGHWTRDIGVSPDGKTLYLAVGSASNAAQGLERPSAEKIATIEAARGVGAAWGEEEDRAVVLGYDPDGKRKRTIATGIRNCSGLTVDKAGAVWCAANERDGLGDDLPPDFVSRIAEGSFYGWPWFYAGANEDPRHKGERPDLAGKVVVPDVLVQPHSAPLGIAFYEGGMFPEDYRGDGFATLHGSWNRGRRTGYKVVRIIMKDGSPTGEYEDFMTGFVTSGGDVWGRPVGVAVAGDGALLVSEDGNDTVWRVTWRGTGRP